MYIPEASGPQEDPIFQEADIPPADAYSGAGAADVSIGCEDGLVATESEGPIDTSCVEAAPGHGEEPTKTDCTTLAAETRHAEPTTIPTEIAQTGETSEVGDSVPDRRDLSKQLDVLKSLVTAAAVQARGLGEQAGVSPDSESTSALREPIAEISDQALKSPDKESQPDGGDNTKGREAWQAVSVANSRSEDTGQFLPPVFLDNSKAEKLFRASYERDFDGFIARRTAAVESLVDELQTLVPQVHDTVRTGMQAAIDEGYIPAAALDRLESAFTQTAIQVVDQSVLGGDLAVYNQSTDTITIGTDAPDYDLAQTVAHEIGGHKVSGGTFVTRGGDTIVRVRRGFVNHEEGVTSGRHYGLDEAVQHHLILSYKHGQFDVVDPDARADIDRSYYEHRKLLAEFVLRSGGIIDLKAITRGSFEDSDESGAVTTDRRAMVMQARAAYGPGAYYKLNQLFEGIDFEYMSAEELAARIHGPELDTDGSIKRPGFIDAEGLSFSFDDEDF